jgi:hypothetical protein
MFQRDDKVTYPNLFNTDFSMRVLGIADIISGGGFDDVCILRCETPGKDVLVREDEVIYAIEVGPDDRALLELPESATKTEVLAKLGLLPGCAPEDYSVKFAKATFVEV